ncbi:MAG TPA: GTP-binding protein [Candidatus Omnitrophica bacterium]|nr:GTP-binding protein [Candidatus Omnitrophota bacterium]
MARAKKVDKIKELMWKPEFIRNMGIVAHIDHGKTTLSDNLLAGAGMISEELAGHQLFLDFDEQEQERGITINAANVSMVHEYEGKEYLINLIDTPGHVDFGGDVTRAMRAVDGVIVVVDAVEGVMPQTETVLRQALKENVKPVLFVNKVDRLIKELELTPQQMQEKLIKVITEVNKLIKAMKPDRYSEWKLDVTNGSVAFGSALYNWAVSVPAQKVTGIGFKEVYEYLKEENLNQLKIILKADVGGTLEATEDALKKITSEEVELVIIHKGVGVINSSDVLLAEVSDAIIVGFKVNVDPKAKDLAKQKGIEIRLYEIVYELIDDIKSALEGMLSPQIKRIFLGRAQIKAVFKLSKAGTVCGCQVIRGKVVRGMVVQLLRDNEVVFEGKIISLKRFKDDVREVKEGLECGINIGYDRVKEGDIIDVFSEEIISRHLER